ncbi:MAG: opine dehydrogenase [Thermosediminibacterales bacterium]|nr:opine dehydrogenase [Thermosediminibacterales bacterium]
MQRYQDVKFAVIGAGNGGCAMAAHLALKGFDVTLYNRSEKRLEPIRARGGILLEGVHDSGFATIKQVTNDVEEAIRDADVIMVTVPATGHRDVARAIAPFLHEDQIVVLNPGRTGGALEFRNILRQSGLKKEITIAEAQTFIYACRVIKPAHVKIFSVKNEVAVAALPAYRTPKVVEILSKAYPEFKSASNVLETSFNNIGAIFHPTPTLLNTGRIETTKGDFDYYIEGISPTVADILEKLDNERLKVASALGVKAQSALEWLYETYGAEGKNLFEALQNNKAYKGIKAPDSVNTRYIFEDVPESLVPISLIGKMLNVDTPILDSIINLACAAHNINYWETGRTIERLGLEGLTREQIFALVMEGEESLINVEKEMEGVVA